VTLPLDTDDIMLPFEANPSQRQVDETDALLPADESLDDMYKEFLNILPGSPHDGIYALFTLRIIFPYVNITHTFTFCQCFWMTFE